MRSDSECAAYCPSTEDSNHRDCYGVDVQHSLRALHHCGAGLRHRVVTVQVVIHDHMNGPRRFRNGSFWLTGCFYPFRPQSGVELEALKGPDSPDSCRREIKDVEAKLANC